MGQNSSIVSYRASNHVDKSKITKYIVDVDAESLDLSDFTSLECIEYECNKIPVITGITNVKRVIVNKMARNMKNIVKAMHYTIPIALLQNNVFMNASSLEIKGDGKSLILDNFDGDRYPNLTTLIIESVIVDSELLCDISKLKLLRQLTFNSCSGLNLCNWNIIKEHCPYLISLSFKSVNIDSELLQKISILDQLVSLEFDSYNKPCDWDKLDLPELLALSIYNGRNELSDIKFLEKHRKLVILRLEISDTCNNIDVIPKLTPKYLYLNKLIPNIILPTSVEMLNLGELSGTEQSIKYLEHLRMLCIDYVYNNANATTGRLEIPNSVLQTHNRMDDTLRSTNKALWDKAFDDIIETIRAQQDNIKVIEPIEVAVTDQANPIASPSVAIVDPTTAYKELLEKMAALTKYIESQKILGK